MAPTPHVGPARVRRFRLKNGLSVVLAPIRGSATASVWVWYRVGSKNEWPGVTGASHWVEHMLFQGSPKYAKGEIDQAIVEVGGALNAFTDYDFTAYFSVVPAPQIGVPLDIEADRMTRATIDPAEVERERTVVLSEREGNENWPEFRVDEELGALAFRQHPYRWEVLGYPGDIRALTPRELAAYYRRFYGPRNAVLVVAGGFDETEIRRRVEHDFGRLPATGEDPAVGAQEPEPVGERRATLTGPGTTPYLCVAYPAPAMTAAEAPAAILLDVLLGGETGLFRAGRAFGPPAEHPSARLYRALVDPGLAVEAVSSFRPRFYPGLFLLLAQAAEGVSLERLETAIQRETDRLARSGPTRAELVDARERIRRGAELAYEGARGTGFRLGYFAMFSDPGFEQRLLDSLLGAGSEAIRSAARSLFRPSRKLVVGYAPDGGP